MPPRTKNVGIVDHVIAESTCGVCMILYSFFSLNADIFIADTDTLYHSLIFPCTHQPTPPFPGVTHGYRLVCTGQVHLCYSKSTTMDQCGGHTTVL